VRSGGARERVVRHRDTPFGLEFIDGQFPSPWDHHVFVARTARSVVAGAARGGHRVRRGDGQPATGSNLPGRTRAR